MSLRGLPVCYAGRKASSFATCTASIALKVSSDSARQARRILQSSRLKHHCEGMRAASSLSGRAALQQLAALLRSSSSMRQSSSWGSNSASSGRRGAGGSSSRRTQAPPPRPRRQQRRAPSAAARGLQQYLVTCHPGLQEVTADELRQPHLQLAHGLSDVSVLAPGRVSFSAPSAAGGYAAALCLHSATRVLQLVHEQVLDPRQPAGDTVS